MCCPHKLVRFTACAVRRGFSDVIGAREASDGIRQYLFSEKIDKRTDCRGAIDALNLMVTEPQGSPRGQGPPRMESGSIFMLCIKILPPVEMGPEADPLLREGGNAAHRVEQDGRKLPGWGQWDLAPQGRKQMGQDA